MESLKFFLRLFMGVLSGILLLAGVAVLVAGIWMKASPSYLQEVLGQIGDVQPEQSLSYLLMAAGTVLGFLGALGCCAAVRDRRCLQLLFFVVALMAVVAEVAGAVVVQWFPGQLSDLLGPSTVELIEEKKALILSVIGGVTALEALPMASSMILYCTAMRRMVGSV